MDDADDGLMLNFASASTSNGAGAKKQRQTAKARFAQKRSLQNGRKNVVASKQVTTEPVAPQPQPVPVPAPRDESEPSPAKKQKSEATSRPSASSSLRPAAGSAAPRQAAFLTNTGAGPSVSARVPPGGVISALFPSHGVLEDVSSSSLPFNAKPYDPTNAPSAASDFASLGLDPLLVRHLSSKMKIGSHPTSIQQTALPHLLHPGLDRDILIQAQTGSGKTLTYLLPILPSLLPLGQESFIDRGVGTLAIVLAPTRELARQIYEVLEKLVSLALSVEGDETSSIRRTRWLVPGLLSGGSTKNHEKQRLRKGCPILISTPGRLLDHLQNTSSFDVGKCRWLVLDEADRLLEMGFEEQLNGIVRALDGRRRLACMAAREAMPGYIPDLTPEQADYIPDDQVMDTLGMTWWSHPRRVVLCSATLDENVQMLAGKTLTNPKILRGGKDEVAPKDATAAQNGAADQSTSQIGKFAAPAQLQQHFVSTPPKLRLVTLLALLRAFISRARRLVKDHNSAADRPAGAGRVIVFMSCTDSVDFHYAAFGGAKMNAQENDPNTGDSEQDESQPTFRMSELVPGVPIFRLHGSMTQQERIKSLKGFSSTKADQEGGFKGSILLCTSVASRGLDLPDVGCVIQLDPPTEGGIEEYLHRVGRTARVGRSGESWLTILPQEAGWVDNVLEANMTIQSSTDLHVGQPSKKIKPASIERILQDGFGGSANTLEYQSRATDVQLAFERWVLSGEKASLLARRGFLSHVRAYATHSADEKQYFNVRALHLGHLAKAFALREAPKTLGAKSASIAAIPRPTSIDKMAATNVKRADSDSSDNDDSSDAGSDYETRNAAKDKKGDGFQLDRAALTKLSESIGAATDSKTSARNKKLVEEALKAAAIRKNKSNATGAASGIQTDAEARMYAKVRALGKLSKKHGLLGAHGTDDFQIA